METAIPVSASRIFRLWSGQEHFVRNRVDVLCPAYGQFRRAGRELQRQLLVQDEEEAIVLLESVHAILGEAATVPIDFDRRLSDRVGMVGGGVARMKRVWGAECAKALEDFEERTREMCRAGSALQNAVVQALLDYIDSDLRFYCHRSSIDAFCNLGSKPQQAIVTPDAYRKAATFDVLLTVGPLRRMGYGRVPEAIVTAPRFRRLQQITWANEHDEVNFGEGNVGPLGFDVTSSWDSQCQVTSCGHPNCSDSSGDTGRDEFDEKFDLDIRARIRRVQGTVIPGTVLRLSGSKMTMRRAGSDVAIYTKGAGRVIRKEAEDVLEGEVILHHERFSLELGPIAPSDDPIVREWREALRLRYAHNTPLFLGALRRSGVSLIYLDEAVRSWMSHQRPQQASHFEIVSRVIGWEESKYRRAWRVFSEQHGAAVQHGLISAELSAEALVSELNSPHCLEALSAFVACPSGAPLRMIVDVSGSTLEVLAYIVEEVESFDQLPERLFDDVTDLVRGF